MSPIFVAIDTPDLDRARASPRPCATSAGGLKLGLEFFAANGPAGVAEMAELGLPIFLDLKLHDIPNTVAKAVQALRPLEPAILTVHAAGGRAMLEDAKAAAPAGTKVVAVTVLTSLDEADLAATGVDGSPAEQVARLAAWPAAPGSTASSARAPKSARRARPGPTASSSSPASARPTATARRPEARRHAARGARRRRLDPGHRPPDHPGRRSRRGGPRDRGDAVDMRASATAPRRQTRS